MDLQRQRLIETWLSDLWPGAKYALAPASADASFRRYFRVTLADGSTRIVMDAPPAHEDVAPWLKVRALFHAAQVHVPDVLAQDQAQGLLLLSDLGTATYLEALKSAPGRADELYRAALQSLLRIQTASRAGLLPDYDRALLKRELDLFPEWYVARHLGVSLGDKERENLEQVFERIMSVNLAEPRVFVHRDYHSRNLMTSSPNPGIVDFQDAVYGPISYDLVSLLKDAYIEWDEEQALDWLIRYWEAARRAGLPVGGDFAEFHRDYEWMGVQRHVKVLGIFARLCHRDGKTGYLGDMPLVAKYLRAACERYGDLAPLLKLLDKLENRQTILGITTARSE